MPADPRVQQPVQGDRADPVALPLLPHRRADPRGGRLRPAGQLPPLPSSPPLLTLSIAASHPSSPPPPRLHCVVRLLLRRRHPLLSLGTPQAVATKEGLKLPPELAMRISTACERNLRRSILTLEVPAQPVRNCRLPCLDDPAPSASSTIARPRPLLRTPARRLRSLEARRDSSSPPRAAPKWSRISPLPPPARRARCSSTRSARRSLSSCPTGSSSSTPYAGLLLPRASSSSSHPPLAAPPTRL